MVGKWVALPFCDEYCAGMFFSRPPARSTIAFALLVPLIDSARWTYCPCFHPSVVSHAIRFVYSIPCSRSRALPVACPTPYADWASGTT